MRVLFTACTRFSPVLLVFLLLLIAPACRRGTSSPTSPSIVRWCDGQSLGTMRATIDGAAWTASRVVANSFGGSLQLSGSDCTYHLFVTVDPVNGLGTYSVAGRDIFVTLSYDGRGPESWTANPTRGGSGTVTLSAFTKPTTLENIGQSRVSGTFAFSLTPINTTGTRVVTDGSFDSGFAAFSP